MKLDRTVLAFDLGASTGRAILGRYDGQSIELKEVHRFDNVPVTVLGSFSWDVLRLFGEIKQGLSKAFRAGGFESVGIDTWGVDFGLLDKGGNLLQNPVHYRDRRTEGLVPEVCGRMGESLYARTGIQMMDINTVFQMYALSKKQPELLACASHALLMPDLLGYFLTGKMASEQSIASTTQMMNPWTRMWDTGINDALGIPKLFPDIVSSGTPLGELTAEIQKELGLPAAQVISVAGHDTACAVVAAPSQEDDFIYISCGTWSLFGTELKSPSVSELSERHNITNEGGYGNTTRFLKNIIGLWLIQETRRQYMREGKDYGYDELERLALASRPFAYFIDPDDPSFVPPGDLPGRVREYCRKTGQGEPGSVGEIVRCIYESIAMKYRLTMEEICECTGKSFKHIHMLGGGVKDGLLCGMAASATGCDIVAGPIEATALGNIAVQLMARGYIADIKEARRVISNSCSPAHYSPVEADAWNTAYAGFLKIIGRKLL